MDIEFLKEQLTAKFSDFEQVSSLSFPPLPCSLSNIKAHEIATEEQLRPTVDEEVMVHWSKGKIPGSPDIAFLVSERYFCAIMAAGLLAGESAPDCAQYSTEDELARWLLVDSWRSFGFCLWIYRVINHFDSMARGWGLAEHVLLNKTIDPVVPSLSRIVLQVRSQSVWQAKPSSGGTSSSFTL